jgi:hypothetical protein
MGHFGSITNTTRGASDMGLRSCMSEIQGCTLHAANILARNVLGSVLQRDPSVRNVQHQFKHQ